MPQRYFAEPYRFVPPDPDPFWCRLARPLWGVQLRQQQVRRVAFRGLDHVEASFKADAGVLLTPNHSAWVDATVIGQLGVRLRRFFFYLVSSHIFRASPWRGRVLQKLGSFSILREGSDLESIRACVDILAKATRPLVVFPEGTWTRQNERLGVVQDGVGLIARQAAKAATRPVVVHPVAIKYWLLNDPTDAVRRRLHRLEDRLTLRPGAALPLVDRVERLTAAYLAVKETQYLGVAQPGGQDERVARLIDGVIAGAEREQGEGPRSGPPIERVRWLRQRLARQFCDAVPADRGAIADRLDDLLFCENLGGHSAAYLRARPGPERLAEAVLRLEETMFDWSEQPVAPLGAVVEVGPALAVGDYPKPRGADRAAGDPLVKAMAAGIQGMLDAQIAAGPPPGWARTSEPRPA